MFTVLPLFSLSNAVIQLPDSVSISIRTRLFWLSDIDSVRQTTRDHLTPALECTSFSVEALSVGSLKHSLLLLARTRRFSRGTSVSLVRHSIPCNIQAIEVHHVTDAFDPVSDPSAVPMHPDKTGCRIRVDYSVHAFEMPVCVCVCVRYSWLCLRWNRRV